MWILWWKFRVPSYFMENWTIAYMAQIFPTWICKSMEQKKLSNMCLILLGRGLTPLNVSESAAKYAAHNGDLWQKSTQIIIDNR